MYHREAIENYPLQVYASALLFSPVNSMIRRLFQHEEPRGVTIKPAMSNGWSACLQTLEGHSDYVTSVAFSHDSTWLASASGDSNIKIWDASSGTCVRTLEGHSSYVTSVVFSHGSTRLVSASEDRTVKIWDASSGTCVHTLEGHSSYVTSVAFSHDSTRFVSTSEDSTIKIWDTSSGTCVRTLEGHSDYVTSVTFSHDSTRLASASWDSTVKIWDTSSGTCMYTLEGHSDYVTSVAFSHDSTRLVSVSLDRTVKIWDSSSRTCVHTLDVGRALFSLSFGSTSTSLHTDIGIIAIPPLQVSASTDMAVSELQYQDVSLSSDSFWIVRDGINVLWIPSEYRPSCSAVSGALVGMGVGSGRIWFCQVI